MSMFEIFNVDSLTREVRRLQIYVLKLDLCDISGYFFVASDSQNASTTPLCLFSTDPGLFDLRREIDSCGGRASSSHIYAASTVPVLPLPARQWTTTTCFAMLWEITKSTASRSWSSVGTEWSFIGKCL